MTAGKADDPIFMEPVHLIGPSDYAAFLRQLRQLLRWIIEQPGIMSPVRQAELKAALDELDDNFRDGINAAEKPNGAINTANLQRERLDDANGRAKLGLWGRARERFKDYMSRWNARHALRCSNPLLDSLSTLVPMLKPVQEFVQLTENVLDATDAAATP
jgi:hypothetical protein